MQNAYWDYNVSQWLGICITHCYALQGGGREAFQAQSQAHGGRLASESSASGKLSGPLPWDVLDDQSDEENNSTAGMH